jgi:predicted outer membrane repeat protein
MLRITHVTIIIILAGAICILTPELQAQTTWYVDDDASGDPGPGDPDVSDPLEDGSIDHPYDAIQEGIGAATGGDTVMVKDGTYTGTGNRDLDFTGKAITVRSEYGAEGCIIDCQGSASDPHRGFKFVNSGGPDSIIRGFTIKNGYMNGTTGYYDGGAIYCFGADVTIIENIFIGNRAYRTGGAIQCYSSNATIENNTATNNTAGTSGGGIYIYSGYAHNPGISNNTFTENTASSRGGGVYCKGSATLKNNIITGNTAASGGGVYSTDSGPRFIKNIISSNEADDGGGIYCWSTNALIKNNFISENVCATGHGGGIYCAGNNYDAATIKNNIVTLNEASEGGGIYVTGGPAYYRKISRNRISGNLADYGGGIYFDSSAMGIRDSVIIGNTAINGGGIYCHSGDSIIQNILVTENTADYGAGIWSNSSGTTIENNTLTANTAISQGGAVSGPATVTNSILWDNTPDEIYGTPTVTYSDVEGDYPGEGNINANPLFVSGPFGGDFYLMQPVAGGMSFKSPCVDAGSGDSPPWDPSMKHLTGEMNRWHGTTRTDLVEDTGIVDMGYHMIVLHPGGINE